MPRWRNWAGNVTARPVMIEQPTSSEDVARVMRRAGDQGLTVRPVGSGHSFTPVAATDHVLLDLRRMNGMVRVDHEAGTATVRAGTTLGRLGEMLASHDMAQENLGDIDEQSIAGAIATGTHGTGAALGGIAQQVEALEIVTGTGEVRRIDRSTPDLLDAARVNLGAMGVVTEVTLRTLPAYSLAYRAERADVDEVLDGLDDRLAAHRHVEFFWIPHTRWAQLKTADVSDAPATGMSRWERFNKEVLENRALEAISRVARARPSTIGTLTEVMGRAIGTVETVAPSHRVFATPRNVRFVEMEYAVPRGRFENVFDELRRAIRDEGLRVHFPVECRFVAADDPWLSPSTGRETAYLAVHMYEGMPHEPFFSIAEAIFRANEGRPHWGKMHTRTFADLEPVYPRLADWTRLRDELDPAGVMLSPYLRRLMGRDAHPGVARSSGAA